MPVFHNGFNSLKHVQHFVADTSNKEKRKGKKKKGKNI